MKQAFFLFTEPKGQLEKCILIIFFILCMKEQNYFERTK